MKKYARSLLILSAAIIILMALPWGVVLTFAAIPGDSLRVTYSFFSVIPYGYACFGPFIAAMGSSVSLFCASTLLFFEKAKWVKPIACIAPLAAVVSFLPRGFSQLSAIGLVIAALLMVQFLVCLKIRSMIY